MENASKAIIMAGGILIAIIIMSLLVMLFSQIGSVYNQEGENLTLEELEKFNKQFATYDRSLYGSELLSLANLISDYNNRLLLDADRSFYEENKIDVRVSFYTDIIGERDEDTNKWIYKSFTKKKNRELSEFKEYNDEIEDKLKDLSGDLYNSAKSTLSELRSLPFVCISNERIKEEYEAKGYSSLKTVKYNKYGRISEMHFIQLLDENISNPIFK